MKILQSLADVNRAFSLEDAADQGYKVRLYADGRALVTSGSGDEYHIHNFECDCSDALFRDGGSYQLPDGRSVCKHVLLVLQARPCEWCEGTMVLDPDGRYFHCLLCQAPFDARLVREERREALCGDQEEVLQEASEVWDAETARLADQDVRMGIAAAEDLLRTW